MLPVFLYKMKIIYVFLIILLGVFILGFSSNSSVGRYQLSSMAASCWVLDTVTGKLELYKYNKADQKIYLIGKGDN